ncbi:hypothetical protein NQ315_015591 [Exocentrus adspersus]|uniref:Uncharacterized protein n=1 Tax=Exocentrus adspersus TaxID=1586481 RepID=A0AAV8V9E0_9CUCU|nr:hypothetical protein NQ315_015591 [Exocentrus adspersus]
MEYLINIESFSNICRVCLKEESDMENIFSCSVDLKLKQCTSVQVEYGDGLPQLICRNCERKLHEAYSFKQLCETNDDILRKIFASQTKGDIFNNTSVVDNFEHTIKDEENYEHSEDKYDIGSHTDNTEIEDQTIESKNSELKCNICSAKLADASLSYHLMAFHPSENSHYCSVSDRHFSEVNRLKSHLRKHRSTKIYECAMCKKTFSKENTLKAHIRRHTGEESSKIPITCKLCSKTFSNSRSLSSHTKIHTGKMI